MIEESERNMFPFCALVLLLSNFKNDVIVGSVKTRGATIGWRLDVIQ